jgi:hypothetical protein
LTFQPSNPQIEVQTMFVRTLVAVTLFTSFLGAAGPTDSDIFSVRSFLNPNTREKIPVTGQLFSNGELKLLVAELAKAEPRKSDKCAIPLQEFKAPKTQDSMAMPVGPSGDSASVMAPPLPACKLWNH